MYWTIPLIVSLAMNIAKLVYPMILIIASHVIIKIKFLLMEPVSSPQPGSHLHSFGAVPVNKNLCLEESHFSQKSLLFS